MAVMGLTIFLRYEKWGWTYNFTKTTGSEDPTTFLPSILFWSTLQACHSNYVTIERFRVSNLANPRLAKVRPLAATFGTAGSTVSHPNYSIDYQLSAANGARRLIMFRGGLQDWPRLDAPTGQGAPGGESLSKYNQFVGQVKEEKLEIRQLDSTATNPNRMISAIRQSAGVPGFLAFSTAPDIGLVVGNSVKIGKINPLDFPGLNGEWKVINVVGTVYTIGYKWRQGAEEVFYPDTGQARKATYQQREINEGNFYKVSSRDTGRPFGLSHGRTKGVSARP